MADGRRRLFWNLFWTSLTSYRELSQRWLLRSSVVCIDPTKHSEATSKVDFVLFAERSGQLVLISFICASACMRAICARSSSQGFTS